MKLITTYCSTCGLALQREKRRIHEAKKYRWKSYCSIECQSRARNTQQTIHCNNDACHKTIKRTLKEIALGNKHFCSQSCATIINNRQRALASMAKSTKKYCANPECKIAIPTRNIYCSIRCQRSLDKVPKEEYARRTLDAIRIFFKGNGRVPFKKELWSMYKPARIAFGTWNNAILAAGFHPNPVMFAKKYLAHDGHPCDSMAEKVIDDWLHEHGISHDRRIPYGKNKMTADFRVGKTLIEFFGLHGQRGDYDRLVKEKQKLWRKQHLKVIALYPKDILPKSKLAKSLSAVL